MQYVVTIIAILALVSVDAWSPNQKVFGSPRSLRRKSSTTVANPVSQPQSPVAVSVSRTMLKYPGNNYQVKNAVQQKQRSSKTKLSNSVLASCDTLPSFRTAHGLLSPETVMRLEEMRSSRKNNQALTNFLSTYRQHGPLSCVPMLSDPDVLPHLTLAMREIAIWFRSAIPGRLPCILRFICMHPIHYIYTAYCARGEIWKPYLALTGTRLVPAAATSMYMACLKPP